MGAGVRAAGRSGGEAACVRAVVGEERVRSELARLATTLGAEEELLAAYEDKLERGLEPNPAALWRRIAEVHDARGQREPASAAWEKAAQTAPGDLVLLRAMPAAACAGRPASTRDRAEATGRSHRQRKRQNGLLVELARLAEEQLKDASTAAWAFERLSQHSPTNAACSRRCSGSMRSAQDKPKWADALERDLRLAREAGFEPMSPRSHCGWRS